MKTFLAQNQFISNPTVNSPRTVEQDVAHSPAAASDPAVIDSCQEPVAADLIQSSCSDAEKPSLQGEEAAAVRTEAAASDNFTSDIPEIFRVARQLCAGARQFIPDNHAIWDAMHGPCSPRALESDPVWADEAPLFLRNTA